MTSIAKAIALLAATFLYPCIIARTIGSRGLRPTAWLGNGGTTRMIFAIAPNAISASATGRDAIGGIITMSKIEWTERTWNPMTGCDMVSPGCANCYAKPMARRLQAIGVPEYRGGFSLAVHKDKFDLPRAVKKPTMWFVNSMSDFFHEKVSHADRDALMAVMRETPHHTYQILTKRADVMEDYLGKVTSEGQITDRWAPNVWLGVSVENRKHGLPRAKLLSNMMPYSMQTTSHIKGGKVIQELSHLNHRISFLSCEPLLECLGKLPLLGISWIIVGGESGHRARPMKKEWVHNIREQCLAYENLPYYRKIPFFFKQWGAFGADGVRRSKKANGRLLDGVEYNEMPERKQ